MTRRRRVCLVTTTQLSKNPRVAREASTLSENGFEVTVLAPAFSQDLLREDAELAGDAYTVKRPVALVTATGGRNGIQHRLRTRLAKEGVRIFGAQLPSALGYGVQRLLDAARKEKSELYIVHLEGGMWVGCELLRDGHAVAADFEDWYSEDLTPAARASRPLRLLRHCEQTLLRNAAYCSTTSHALANALAATYRAAAPAVIYNAFPLSERQTVPGGAGVPDRAPDNVRPSLYWVSQTVGEGRGLEMLLEALREVTAPIELHVRGSCSDSYAEWLRSSLPSSRGHTLHLHAQVRSQEMLARMAEHDIGLALERRSPQSRNLTVTNKILHYFVGGLAVVATDTDGQAEVAAAAPNAVTVCKGDDPRALADSLSQLLASPEKLRVAKAASVRAANEVFCWERQVPILLKRVEGALRGVRRPSPEVAAGAAAARDLSFE